MSQRISLRCVFAAAALACGLAAGCGAPPMGGAKPLGGAPRTLSPTDDSMRITARWPYSACRTIACRDGVAYLGTGGVLQKVAFTHQARLLKEIITDDIVNRIRLSGETPARWRVYVAHGKSGLAVYDADLNRLAERRDWVAGNFAVNDRFVIATGDRSAAPQGMLHLLDRATLEPAGTLELPQPALDVQAHGSWLACTMLDQSAGRSPRLAVRALRLTQAGVVEEMRDFAPPRGMLRAIYLDGPHLHLAYDPQATGGGDRNRGRAPAEGPESFYIARHDLGAAAGSDPVILGPFDGPVQSFVVSGGHVYAAGREAITIYAIEEPARRWSEPAGPIELAVEPDSGRVYLSSRRFGPHGVRVIEPGADAQITSRALWAVPGEIEGVFIKGTTLYAACCNDGFRTFDIGDEGHVRPLAWLDTPWLAEDVWVEGRAAYVADGHGLAVYDVTDPARPLQTQYLQNPENRMDKWIEGVRVAGDMLYVSAQTELRIYDRRDPLQLRPLAVLPVQGARDAAVQDGLCHLAGVPGYTIVDVADPARPRELAFLPLGDDGYDVEVKDQYAYVSVNRRGVCVIDFSTPAAPRVVAEIQPPDRRCQGVEIFGAYLYVANVYSEGVVKYDIRNPLAPRLVGSVDTPGGALNVKIGGGRMAIADYSNGLVIGTP